MITVDFGYVVNSGVMQKQEIYNETIHDQRGITVEMIMSDDQVHTSDANATDMFISLKFGDVIVSGKLV